MRWRRRWANLGGQHRRMLLLAMASLLILLGYQFSLKHSVAAYLENQDLVLRLNAMSASRAALSQGAGGLHGGPASPGMAMDHAEMVARLGLLCRREGLRVKNFSSPTVESHQNFAVATFAIQIVGPFKGLVKVANQLEQDRSLGYVASLDFSRQTDGFSKRSILTMTLYLQQFKLPS